MDAVLGRRTRVKIDYTQLAVQQPDSGNDRARQWETDPRKPAGSTQSFNLTRHRKMRGTTVPKRTAPSRLEQADRREAQIERASRFERGRRVGTPEQKALNYREAERQPHSGSKSRTSQTDTW